MKYIVVIEHLDENGTVSETSFKICNTIEEARTHKVRTLFKSHRHNSINVSIYEAKQVD